jgi:hypothetical protein
MNIFSLRHLLSFVLFTVPAVSWAQVNDVFDLTDMLYSMLTRVGEFFWVLAIMLFFWGVVKFIANAADTAEHAKGKQFMIWGVIAFVVIVSLWAIVNLILVDTLGVSSGGEIPYIDKDGNSL